MQSSTKDTNVNVVILREPSQVLLVKNKARWKEFSSGNAFLKPSKWGLPNGRKELGENEIETAVRETEEETGFLVEVEPATRVEDGAWDHINVTFLARIIGGEMRISFQDQEITDCRWFSVYSLPQDIYKSHQRRLQSILDKIHKKP